MLKYYVSKNGKKESTHKCMHVHMWTCCRWCVGVSILYRRVNNEENADDNIPDIEAYHPIATARMRVYVAGDSYEGLMKADGHVIMMPLYKDKICSFA